MDRFERIVRSIGADNRVSAAPDLAHLQVDTSYNLHPFETRNMHPDLPPKVRSLFDDGYGEHAVFEAFKFVEKEVKRISKLKGKTGYALMMDAFNETNAKIQINSLVTDSEIDEQRGSVAISRFLPEPLLEYETPVATRLISAIRLMKRWTISLWLPCS